MEVTIIHDISDTLYQHILAFANVTIYHTKEWHQFLEHTFGWKVQAAIGSIAGNVVIFLPFITKYRINFRKYNICLPFSQNVGLIYDRDYAESIDEFFVQLDRIIDNIEIHCEIKHENLSSVYSQDVVILDMSNYHTIDELFGSFNYKSIRYMVHRAQKNDVIISKTFHQKHFDIFYELIVKTRRRQGAPVYPKSFFKNLYNHFKNSHSLFIYLAFYQEIPISGALFFYFQNSVTYAYSASVNARDFKKLGASELMLWHAIKDAFTEGIRYFDFGITPINLPGSRRFKQKWGGECLPFPYTYLNRKNKPGHPVKRDGTFIQIISSLLRVLPSPIFKHITPVMLKWVI